MNIKLDDKIDGLIYLVSKLQEDLLPFNASTIKRIQRWNGELKITTRNGKNYLLTLREIPKS